MRSKCIVLNIGFTSTIAYVFKLSESSPSKHPSVRASKEPCSKSATKGFRCSVQQDPKLHLYMQSCFGTYPNDDSKPFGISYKEWPDLNLGQLAEYSKYYWTASNTCVALPTHERLPHMKCLRENEVAGDDRLLRGELIAIGKIMTARLNTKSLRPHTVAPVMLYSVMGPQQLRVLEAYFNGKNLIIRKTKLYDMKQEDTTTVDLLIRWWLGFAVGETKSVKTAPLP